MAFISIFIIFEESKIFLKHNYDKKNRNRFKNTQNYLLSKDP